MRKVSRGDPLIIRADTFNTLIDAARDFQGRQHNILSDNARRRPDDGTILVRNDSGADRNRFDVLGLRDPVFTPSDNENDFLAGRVALRGVTPEARDFGRFAVLLEPVARNEIGRAAVQGVHPVRVFRRGYGHHYADVRPNNASSLQSDWVGAAELLWMEQKPPDQMVWALARLGPRDTTPISVRVKGHRLGGLHLVCRDVDSRHEEVGEPFDVWVISLPWREDFDDRYGYVPVLESLPRLRIGRMVRVYWGVARFNGVPDIVEGWLTHEHLIRAC